MPSYQALTLSNNIHDVTSDHFREGFTTLHYGLFPFHAPNLLSCHLATGSMVNNLNLSYLAFILGVYLVPESVILPQDG